MTPSLQSFNLLRIAINVSKSSHHFVLRTLAKCFFIWRVIGVWFTNLCSYELTWNLFIRTVLEFLDVFRTLFELKFMKITTDFSIILNELTPTIQFIIIDHYSVESEGASASMKTWVEFSPKFLSISWPKLLFIWYTI